MLVDKNSRFKNRQVVLEKRTFFGQLQNIFLLCLDNSAALRLQSCKTIILAAIRNCANTKQHNSLDIHYYTQNGRLEVVDMNCVQCVVGRVQDLQKKEWAILDRSGDLARAVFNDD
jgi:hypothetical protein